MPRSGLLLPSLVVAGSGLLWGIWWIPLRWLESSGLEGDRASFVLYVVAVALMLPFVYCRRRHLRSGGRHLLLVGLFSGVAFGAWNHALIDGDVVRVTLLFYLAPIWGTLLGAVYFRDPIRPLRGLSILLGISGAAVVLGFQGGVPLPRSIAEWMALVSGVLFAFAAVYSRKAPQVETLEKTFLNCVFGGLSALAMILLLPSGGDLAMPSLAPGVVLPLALCLFWLVPVTWMLLWGATRLDAGRVGILLLLEVMAAAASAAILTDEPLGWREALGCVLIVGAGLVEGLDEIRARREGRAAAF
jgi:drug/metabolite transporter (DMT)-like permease